MKLKTLLIICTLPIALLAKEDNLAKKSVSRLDDTKTIDVKTKIDAELVKVTESEFTGDSAVDASDAGNVLDSATTDSAAEAAVDAANAKKISESIAKAQNQGESESETSDDDDASDSEGEMSQEEADTELAADMAAVDSVSDSLATLRLLEKLNLDMTTAIIPTESRRISGPYGIRTYRMHRGVDLGLCHGEDRTIVAAFAGTVVKVRNQGRRKGYGKYVIIDHGNGLTTLYAHLAKWTVNVGDTLQAGDTLGIGGNTGRSFGAHLHFEMRYHGIYIDPTTVFNFEEGTFHNVVAELDPVKLQEVENGYQKELSKHRYYKVRRGDCLGKIARKYGISVTRLKQLNKIKGNMIRPGQVLRCS